MSDHVDPAHVIAAELGGLVVPGRPYPAALPAELAPWHCYIADSGHNILIVTEHGQHTVPAPVKSVLRAGWKLTAEGLVQCNLPYDPNLGLDTDPADDEFDADQARDHEPLHRYVVGELYHPDKTQWPDGQC